MTTLQDLPELPDSDLDCTRCGAAIERGYVTVTGTNDGYAYATDGAVCDACGWRDVGATGCAPTLGDFGTDGLLVRVEREDGRLRPADVTDR